MTDYPSFNPPKRDANSDTGPGIRQHTREIAWWAYLASQGKLNARTDVTLTANAASTTLQDPRIGAFSYIGLSPLTANAAGALATTYVSSRTEGLCVFTHANTSTSDRQFMVLIIG